RTGERWPTAVGLPLVALLGLRTSLPHPLPGVPNVLLAFPLRKDQLRILENRFQKRRRIAGGGLLHIAAFVACDLEEQAVGDDRSRLLFGDVPRGSRLVAVLDQKPGRARFARTRAQPDEHP